VAVFALTVGLTAWMVAKVAEHPGMPREAGELPAWFAGGSGALHRASEHPAPPAGAAAAHAPSAADGEFVEIAGGEIEIALREYEMKPSRIKARPGTVVFVLRNEGRFSHDFHVEGPAVDAYAAKFSPGRTVRLEVTLQEGRYKISCPLSNHDQRGMHGTLVAGARGS